MSVSQSTRDEHSGPVQVRISETFNSPDSDVWYQSSDHVSYLVNSDNIRVNAPGFPLLSEKSIDTTIPLPETATILDVLFRFCYPVRHPDLMSLDFDTFAHIAEAVEKYQVFAAVNICNVRMRKSLSQHAVEVLAYSIKHNYPKLLEETAPLLLDEPLSNILPRLPSHLVIPWVLQREQYANVLKRAIAYHHTMPQYMDKEKVLSNLNPGTGSLLVLFKLDMVFDSTMEMAGWRASIEADLQNIPALIK